MLELEKIAITTKPRVIGKNTYHDLTNSNGELLSDFLRTA